jgi:8-oxo-dGTP pyrophosphatase MutT (NUDIX family)
MSSAKTAMTKTKQPKFELKPGQTDYSKARWAPVINCVVKYKNKILLVQRSPDMHFYPGYWNGVSGFLDDQRSLKEKVEEELSEELGISKNKIKRIKLGEIFDQDEPKYEKTWIVHPVLVEVKTDKIQLDWEAKKYQWLPVSAARKLKLLPNFNQVLINLSL